MEKKLFVATKAFIKNSEGKILILRESDKYEDGSNKGKYVIPGGRIEFGEKLKYALIREVKEETNLDIEIGKIFHTSEWSPIVRDEQWHIVGLYFKCKSNTDEVKLSQDHDSFEWINPEDYNNYNLTPTLGEAFEEYLIINQ